MSDKIVEDGQMANDPETDRSYVVPESQDDYLVKKQKWKWKPARLIFLWLTIETIKIILLFIGHIYFNIK